MSNLRGSVSINGLTRKALDNKMKKNQNQTKAAREMTMISSETTAY